MNETQIGVSRVKITIDWQSVWGEYLDWSDEQRSCVTARSVSITNGRLHTVLNEAHIEKIEDLVSDNIRYKIERD